MTGPTRPRIQTAAAHLPGRLLRAVRLSPPLLLMALTVLALLLAISTARAQSLEPPQSPAEPDAPALGGYCERELATAEPGAKWIFFAATCDLARARYEGFSDLVPREHLLVVAEGFGDFKGTDDPEYRHVYAGDVSLDSWRDEIRPVLQLLSLTDEQRDRLVDSDMAAPLECDDAGICRQSTPDGDIELRFVLEDGSPRLLLLSIAYFDIGC